MFNKVFVSLFIVIAMSFGITVNAQEHNHDHNHDHKARSLSAEDIAILKAKLPNDIVYGEETAPIVIVEYASLSCSHCRDFHENIFGKMKKEYKNIDLVKLVYRHFPLNAPALRAAMLVDCQKNVEDKKLFLDALFKSQAEWAYQREEQALLEKLEIIGKIGGLDITEFKACLINKEAEKELLTNQLQASKMGVQSTPTIFINGVKHTGKKDYDSIVDAVEKEITALKEISSSDEK